MEKMMSSSLSSASHFSSLSLAAVHLACIECGFRLIFHLHHSKCMDIFHFEMVKQQGSRQIEVEIKTQLFLSHVLTSNWFTWPPINSFLKVIDREKFAVWFCFLSKFVTPNVNFVRSMCWWNGDDCKIIINSCWTHMNAIRKCLTVNFFHTRQLITVLNETNGHTRTHRNTDVTSDVRSRDLRSIELFINDSCAFSWCDCNRSDRTILIDCALATFFNFFFGIFPLCTLKNNGK